jgi:hypothetical protein
LDKRPPDIDEFLNPSHTTQRHIICMYLIRINKG